MNLNIKHYKYKLVLSLYKWFIDFFFIILMIFINLITIRFNPAT